MKVLITGLNGFTGQYLEKDLINRGHTVVGLMSDLMDANAVSEEVARIKPEAVIHLGGVSFVNEKDVNLIYQVNLLGTRNLLSALSSHAECLKKVILASTAIVYGNRVEGMLSETAELHPANDYGVSKLAMEYMASLWMTQLPITIVRPFNYTGVGQPEHFVIPKIVSHFKMKKPSIELGNLDVAREFGDVRAVSEIYCDLLDQEIANQTLNICTGKAYALKDVISICEKITQHKMEVRVNPQYVRANDAKLLCGDNSRLKQYVKSGRQISFEDTLTWMLEK